MPYQHVSLIAQTSFHAYLFALSDTRRDNVDANLTAQVLPDFQILQHGNEIVVELGFEDLDAALLLLPLRPLHVLHQLPEFRSNSGLRIWSEARELVPVRVALGLFG